MRPTVTFKLDSKSIVTKPISNDNLKRIIHNYFTVIEQTLRD